MPPVAKLRAVTVDCPEPKVLADFYAQLTGFEVAHSDDNFAGLSADGGLWLGFQRVENFTPPVWPSQTVPQQFHLDFGVDDLDEAEAWALELGATKAAEQPGGERWRVFLDPVGHPFCLAAF